MGCERYPTARSLLTNADGGGSNGARLRLWKYELQSLADELNLTITACHLPPGTSKWNKIEHRLFSFITQNWRGRPLGQLPDHRPTDRRDTTKTGLIVKSELDTGDYPAGIKITDAQMDQINLQRHDFHGDWNYTIRPRQPTWPAAVRPAIS